MVCPDCNTLNRDIAKYCKECGRFLSETCPSCGSKLPESAKFCDICGQQIRPRNSRFEISSADPTTVANRRPLDKARDISLDTIQGNLPRELLESMKTAQAPSDKPGERRIVTMLFCDVQGSTKAAENLDPEEWAEIINGAFEYMISPITHYDGTLARLMGDGILAFFGAPSAHEDDPVRAVLAGLDIVTGIGDYCQEIRSSYELDFNVRVGINTGRVVVGAVGSDVRHEYSALGDAINVAARMEQSAAPGTVLIAEDTYKIVKPLFEFEELGGLLVKGKEQPVQAFRVIGRLADPGRLRGIAGRETPLVGREKELQILQEASNELGEGHGGLLFLVGQAGLGKSRLLRELQALWKVPQAEQGSSSPFTWTYSTTASYEERDAYSVMKNQLRALFSVDDDVDLDQVRTRLYDSLNSLPADKQSAASAVIQNLLGIDEVGSDLEIEGEAYRRLLFTANLELLKARALKKPIVIMIDNLHWSDPASAAWIMHLSQIVDSAPVLFVFAMRPDREAVSWEIKTAAEKDYPHRYKDLHLHPLADSDCITLTETILGSSDLPEKLRSLILGNSEGNPYFIEEVIRTLIDGGALVKDSEVEQWRLTADSEEIVIPENLHALLAARFDGLIDEARHVLQVASVVGTTFHYGIMQKLVQMNGNLDRELALLQQREFIVQGKWDQNRSYTFRSTLLQEIVYRSILRKLRSEFHLLVAEALLDLYSENIDEHNPELAHHFYQAKDHRALQYLKPAGDAAFQLYANTEAEEYYGQALEIAISSDSVTVEELQYLFERRGRALEINSQFPEALANYLEMEKLAIERQERRMELAAIVAQTTLYTMATEQFNPEKAKELAQRALQMARSEDDRATEAKIYWNLLNIYRFSDNREKALEYGQRSLALARELGIQEQIAYSANDISHAYTDLGRFADANDILVTASDLWRKLENLPMLADSLATASVVSTFMGRFDLAIDQSEEGFRISQSIENGWGQSYSRLFVGNVYWERGEPNRAIDMMESCMRFGKEVDFIVASAFVGAELAKVHAQLGDLQQAKKMANEALRVSDEYIATYRPMSLIALGLIHLLRGELSDLDTIVDDLQDYSDMRIASFSAEVNYFICLYLSAINDLDAAAEQAGKLANALTKNNALTYLPRVLCLQGEIWHKIGLLDEASQVLKEAQITAESIGALWPLWQILASQAKVQESLGDAVESTNSLRQATSILDLIADRLPSDDMRVSFLDSAYVSHYLQAQ
jgi:class 3 adenylate cyclase/predicted ATPase